MASVTASPGAGTNSTALGTAAWTSTNNILTSDDLRASTGNIASGAITNALAATSYGFAIPADATINGIELAPERHQSVTQQMRDHTVQLLKAGALAGNNKAATTTDWPTAEASVVYGGPSDLWGTTWTPADVNHANFGAVVAATNPSATASQPRVDHMPITVYYTETGSTLVRKARALRPNRVAVHHASSW